MDKSEFSNNSDVLFPPSYQKPLSLFPTNLGSLVMMIGAISFVTMVIYYFF